MDVQTLFFVEASLLFLFSLTMMINSVGLRAQNTTYWFAASNFCGGLGLIAHSLRPEASEFITVVAANFLLYLELSLLNKAVADFVGHGRRMWLAFLAMSVMLTSVSGYVVFRGLSHGYVVDCISVATISTSCASAILLYRYSDSGRKVSIVVMASLFAMYCLHNVFCIFDNMIHPHFRFYHIWIDRTLISGLSVGYLLMSSARLRNMLETQANTDYLTGTLNRRAMEQATARLCTRKKSRPLCVSGLMLDLDNFKGINDTYGHHAGDLALRALADCLRQTMRGNDLIARLGGDEFVVVLAGTSAEEADGVASRLEQHISEIRVQSDHGEFAIRASIGVTSLGQESFQLDDLIRLGDRALYAAKIGKRRDSAEDIFANFSPAQFSVGEISPLLRASR